MKYLLIAILFFGCQKQETQMSQPVFNDSARVILTCPDTVTFTVTNFSQYGSFTYNYKVNKIAEYKYPISVSTSHNWAVQQSIWVGAENWGFAGPHLQLFFDGKEVYNEFIGAYNYRY